MIRTVGAAAAQSRIRRRVWPLIHSLKETHTENGYAQYALPASEYACTIDHSLTDARKLLLELGYRPEPIAALKADPDDERIDRGSWVKRDRWLADMQYHVHIFEAEGSVEYYAHYEWSWIPAPWDPKRPWRHYNPPDGYPDPEPAIARLQRELSDHGIGYR